MQFLLKKVGYVEQDEVQEITILHSNYTSHITRATGDTIIDTRTHPHCMVCYMEESDQTNSTN